MSTNFDDFFSSSFFTFELFFSKFLSKTCWDTWYFQCFQSDKVFSLIGNPSREYLESFQYIGFHPLPKLRFQAKTTGTCFLYEWECIYSAHCDQTKRNNNNYFGFSSRQSDSFLYRVMSAYWSTILLMRMGRIQGHSSSSLPILWKDAWAPF